MNCYYCDKIKATTPAYASSPATKDLGSETPRCDRHWRFLCGKCTQPAHFMATAYCEETRSFFCSHCATATERVERDFWAWSYIFRYTSPWSGREAPSLDRMEFEGSHPLLHDETAAQACAAISPEQYLVRYPEKATSWRPEREPTDDDVRANWTRNARRWDAHYDDDGDHNRRYQSDESMLRLLGEVRGQRVLDVGSGQGYLCRKLARAGAAMTGVELSDGLLEIAAGREGPEPLGIIYHRASASEMAFLESGQFDKAIANYVLMDIVDYEAALAHLFRVLRPGGRFVAVISNPTFGSGPVWESRPPDSPRREERICRVDNYFRRGPFFVAERDLDPILSFHRPLRDYWRAFKTAGFTIDDFEEPSITDRGRRELPQSEVERALRVPYSCIFRLGKPG